MKRVKHKVQLQCFSADPSKFVDQNIIDSYKKKGDDNPQFRVYCVAHEGDAKGRLVGHGKTITRYADKVIRKLHDTFKKGVGVFLGHGDTNDHDGRQKIGEIVKSHLERVNGVLNQFAAVYIDPKYRDEKLDVASLETEITCVDRGDGTFDVKDVEPITGLALGDGAIESPGFENATLRAQLQCFIDEHSKESVMDLEELIAAIKSGRYGPSDLFTRSELVKDDTVKALQRSHSDKEFNHRKSVEEKLAESEQAKSELQAKFDEKSKGFDSLMDKMKGTVVKEVFDELVKDADYSDKAKKFMELNLKDIDVTDPSDEKALKKDVGKFMEVTADKYKDFAKQMGLEDNDDNNVGVGGNDDFSQGGSEKDLTDPTQNDFIAAE